MYECSQLNENTITQIHFRPDTEDMPEFAKILLDKIEGLQTDMRLLQERNEHQEDMQENQRYLNEIATIASTAWKNQNQPKGN